MKIPADNFPNCRTARLRSGPVGLFCLILAGAPGLSPRADAQTNELPITSYVNRPLAAVRLTETDTPPVIDGDLNDAVWKRASKAHTFLDTQNSRPVADQTEAYLLYDKTSIYVGFYCHESQPDQIVARETVRDADLGNDDTVRVIFDTFKTFKDNDSATFVLNAIGTQRTFAPGGRAGKVEWQGDWNGAVKRVSDGWTAEMRIPWAILPYPRGKKALTMGINLVRRQQRTKITSQWSDLGPQGFQEREGFWQDVEPPTQSWRPRPSFLPYFLPSAQQGGDRSQFRVGLDARYQPSPELTGVATLNPDFASVEGAVESIGFTRSERFVPERRPFFLEGRDYINLGQGYEIGPFFNSTRIQKVDTGVKFYGKLTPQTTVGMLGTFALNQQANFVTNLRREFSPTSGVNLLLQQRLAPGEDNTVAAFAPYFRKGKWSLNGQIAQTLGPGAGGLAYTGALNLEDKNLFTTTRFFRVGSTFVDRLGYIPFNDFKGFTNYTNWATEWRHGFFRTFNFEFSPQWDWHMDGRPFRRRASANIDFETRSDYGFGFFVDGGKFDDSTDFTYGLHLNGGVSNRFRQWRLSLSTGQQADLPYTSFGPSVSIRLFKHLDVSLGSFVENYQGISQQHILTFNYELSKYKAFGGRAVLGSETNNFYVSYRNSGHTGTDTYFIIGDPNARRFVKRVMMKMVFAI